MTWRLAVSDLPIHALNCQVSLDRNQVGDLRSRIASVSASQRLGAHRKSEIWVHRKSKAFFENSDVVA